MLVIAVVCACESKEEEKFFDLMDSVKFYNTQMSSIFRNDWKSITDEGVTYTFVKVDKFEDSLVAKYISTEETAVFLGFIDDRFGNDGGIYLYTTGIVNDNISKSDIFNEVFGYDYHIGHIDSGITNLAKWEVSSKSKNKKRLQEDGASTDLSKIKLVDFRVCSDRDAEKFLKSINSLSENEREELAYLFFVYSGLIIERDYMNKDRFMDYYRKVKNEQTYKFDFWLIYYWRRLLCI